MFFVSKHDLGKNPILKPRVPENFMTTNGFEDHATARICVTPTIDKCLMALSDNLADKVLFVYETKNIDFITPTVNQVPDVNLTNESWFVCDTQFMFVKRILVLRAKENFKYSYGNAEAELWSWHWQPI